MRIDITTLAERLAGDDSVSDYDFWRALGKVNDELYQHQRAGTPVPIRLLQHRRVILDARRHRRTTSFR